MINREQNSTERIAGKQLLQVCHNLRNPISQIFTASSIGVQLTDGNDELKKMFEIILNASRLFAETITTLEKRAHYEEQVLPERFNIISFLRQQILFFGFDERMRYRTKCEQVHEREEVFVSAIPSDMLLIISNILYFLLSISEQAEKNDLRIISHINSTSMEIEFLHTSHTKNEFIVNEQSQNELIQDLSPFLSANNSQLDIKNISDHSLKVNLEIPLSL